MKIVKCNNITATIVGNDVALLNTETGMYHAFNGMGSEIWHMIDQEIEIGDMIDKLLIRYEVDEERCYEEVHAFIKNLVLARLVTIDETGR